jgi:hypothetical protein
MDSCIFCGRANTVTHHLIFGSLRRLADEDGLTIPVCPECHTYGHTEVGFRVETAIHDNPRAEDLSKMLGQALYEKNYYKTLYETITGTKSDDISRQAFLNRYGRSFL